MKDKHIVAIFCWNSEKCVHRAFKCDIEREKQHFTSLASTLQGKISCHLHFRFVLKLLNPTRLFD